MFTWITRIGLGFLAPYMIPALITALVGGGLGANWWFQWLQISDVILLCALGALIYLYAVSKYEWAKLLYVAGMVIVGYFAGRFHESDLQQPRIEAARLEVHKQYKDKRDAEIARLEKVNLELRNKATALGVKRLTDNARLRKERDNAIEAAKKLPDADSTFYTPDDIILLNKLRHDPKRPRIQGSGRKAKP